MCEYCDPDSSRCCIWQDNLSHDFYIEIETGNYDTYFDQPEYVKEWMINYCPYCGRKLNYEVKNGNS